MNPVLKKGVDPKKLIMGLSAHGRMFNVTWDPEVTVRPPVGLTIGGSVDSTIVGSTWTSFYEVSIQNE